MAKKKVEFIANVDKKEEPDYKEVHETPLSEIIGEPQEEEKKEEPEVAPEVKKEPEKVEEKEVEFDPVKFKEEIVNEIVSKTTQSKEEAKDEYKEFEKSIWDKEGRTPTYQEALAFVKDQAIKSIKEEQIKEQQAKEEQERQAKEQESAQVNSFNKYVDEQLADLESSGKLPKTEDARKALFQAMLEVNTKRAQEGKPLIYSIKEIFYEHYKAPNTQPAGADAPVVIGRGAGEQPQKEISPNDYRNKSWFDILSGK